MLMSFGQRLGRSLGKGEVNTMKARWLLLAILMLLSCTDKGSTAKIDYVRPANAPPYNRVLLENVPTVNWGCTHSFAPYKEIARFEIRLPNKPENRKRYEASQVTLNEDYPPYAPILLTGGYVVVDVTKLEVEVALQTTKGPFWANGIYPPF